MATYNKRGYKAPKPKVEEEVLEENQVVEEVIVDDSDSTTAGVFNALDESASKTEDWVLKNQKTIFSVIAAIAVVTVGYIVYQRFVVEPKEEEAANAMFEAQQSFQKATEGTKSDSLYNVALKGSAGKEGFIALADKYSGTAAGNLANYYVGMAYLNTGKYTEAISYLEKFSSKDIMLSTLATGAIGDAYAEKKQLKEAFEYYKKAAEANKNDFTTPRYMLKAAQVALSLGNKADALTYLTEIKEKYESAPEAQMIDGLIGLAQ